MSELREVIIIPATIDYGAFTDESRQLRVVSYSRVSTDSEDQLSSFHAQKTYYTDLILRTPHWTLAGCYADEGISGASAEKRPDFMKMIRHCKNGKIDFIITKSISRFARNTLDSIGFVRKLKARGIGVIFEKEGINTLEENSEVILTILASLAQEELNSISQNVKWGKRRAMQEGKVYWNYSRIYAFIKGEDGKPTLIPGEAEVIKQIYKLYLQGESEQTIMHILNAEETPSPTKKSPWRNSTIQSILQNERFCGDVMLQKTYVADPITKKVMVNNGKFPKIFIKNNHVAVVSREIYKKAQEERARRTNKRKVTKTSTTEQGKYSSMYALNDILICGHCCTPYKRVTWRKRSGDKQIVWRCISRLNYGDKYCKDSVSVDEESLHIAIMEAINKTTGSRKELAPILTAELMKAVNEEHPQIDIEELKQQCEDEKAKVMELLNQGNIEVNTDKMHAMSNKMRELTNQVDSYTANGGNTAISIEMAAEIAEFLSVNIENDTEIYTEYNDTLIRQLISTIKIIDEHRIKIYFKCGIVCDQTIQAKVRPLHKAS